MSSPLDLDLPKSKGPGSAHLESEFPASHTNGSANTNGDLLNNLANSAKSTMSSVANHPTVQDTKNTIVNGPVGQSVQNQAAATSSEFKDLADARKTPAEPAATGQPLTHYHSLFYRLLSWKNPRATGIFFISTVLFIFAARYLNVIRYFLKGTYMLLGIMAAAEIAGQTVLGGGLATKVRPRKYFTIPKESLERFLDDAEQFINFFVIEAQRIVFAENIWVTLGAFVSSFLSYFLIKFVPMWGLALIFDSVLFLGPLIYIQNKEFIDEHLAHAQHLASSQAGQVRELASKHTSNATESLKGYTSEYTKKAQELVGSAKAKTSSTVQSSDFPSAPKQEPLVDHPSPVADPQEPQAVPAL